MYLNKLRNLTDPKSKFSFNCKGILIRNVENKNGADENDRSLIVVFYCLIEKILKLAQDVPVNGHFGRRKAHDRIVCKFTWPGITNDINEYCRTCDVCQRVDKTGSRTRAEMVCPIISNLFQRISCDIVGPLTTCEEIGYRFIFIFMEYAFYFLSAYALTNQKSVTLAREVIEYFSLLGLCKQIVHDLGLDIMSKLFTVLLHSISITQLKSTVCHAQTNYVERLHRVLKKMLRAYDEQQKSS